MAASRLIALRNYNSFLNIQNSKNSFINSFLYSITHNAGQKATDKKVTTQISNLFVSKNTKSLFVSWLLTGSPQDLFWHTSSASLIRWKKIARNAAVHHKPMKTSSQNMNHYCTTAVLQFWERFHNQLVWEGGRCAVSFNTFSTT